MIGCGPADVPCAGCGESIPYDTGIDGSHGEHLSTPIGRCFVRTHHSQACVASARARLKGRPVWVGPSLLERVLQEREEERDV